MNFPTNSFHSDQWYRPATTFQQHNQENSFSLMSYNILADYLVDPTLHHYPASPEQCNLEWDARGPKVIDKIMQYDPDLLMLQEVDHYDYLAQALLPYGYQGVFLKRTGDKQDGVATFYRRSRFRLRAHHDICYRQQDLHPYLDRDNVGLVLDLELVPRSESFNQDGTSSNPIAIAETEINLSLPGWKEDNPICLDDQVGTVSNAVSVEDGSGSDMDTGPTTEEEEDTKTEDEEGEVAEPILISNPFALLQDPASRKKERYRRKLKGSQSSNNSKRQTNGTKHDNMTDCCNNEQDVEIIQGSSTTHPRRKGRRRLLVSNTHLLYNPKRGDIKLAQLQLLLSHLEELSRTNKGGSPEETIPVILGGDFNLTPQSALYFFLRKGYLLTHGLDRRQLSGQIHRQQYYDCFNDWVPDYDLGRINHRGSGTTCGYFWQDPPEKIHYVEATPHTDNESSDGVPGSNSPRRPNAKKAVKRQRSKPNTHKRWDSDGNIVTSDVESEQNGQLENNSEGPLLLWDTSNREKYTAPQPLTNIKTTASHKLSLDSAYGFHSLNGDTGEPAFTTYHKQFKGTVDYIWFTSAHFKLVSIVEIPLKGSLDEFVGLPSIFEPSDHLPLVVRFQFIL